MAEKIVISKSLKEIPDVAFGRTNDTVGLLLDKAAVLLDIVIPEGVKKYWQERLGCKANAVSLPESLSKDIGDNAFALLAEVTIPLQVLRA